MNVAIFASNYFPHLGGVEEHCRQLAAQLKRRGQNVIVLTNRWPRDLPAYELIEGVPVFRIPMRVPDGRRKAHINYQLTHRLIRRQVRGIVRSHNIEVIHVQCVSANGFYALDVAEHLSLPIVLTMHGELTMDSGGLFQRSRFARTLMRALVSKAVAITACSKHTLDEARHFLGHEFTQTAQVVHNGIQLDDWLSDERFVSRRPFLFSLGRLVHQKGFDVLIKAFARVVKEGNVSHDLLIAGEGEAEDVLRYLAAELGVADRVQFYGRAERREVVSLFLASEFFVLPSRHEPFGIVNLEAMAAGKAILAADVGGVSEIVRHGENGLLFRGDDESELANGMSKLLSEPGYRAHLGLQGLQDVRKFDWSRVTESYLQLYSAALKTSPSDRLRQPDELQRDASPPEDHDVIFVSMENWDQIWRRNQFICAEMARRHPSRKILFVGLARDFSHDVRRGNWRSLWNSISQNKPRPLSGFPGIHEYRPLKLLPNTVHWGRLVNEYLFRRGVRGAARCLKISKHVLWLNPHSAVHMVGKVAELAVIYDITDDWTSLSQSPASAQLIKQQDEELCRKADATVVCSKRLFEMKQNLSSNLHLIANGVDAAHYESASQAGPIPDVSKGWEKPVLGYTGSIHGDRVDIELVVKLAKHLRDNGGGSVVLVGPIMLKSGELSLLQKCANIYIPGPVAYNELPYWMRSFDICITPHRVTPFTESLNPIKLWEYLAVGKPILSTNVAGFRDYPELVHIADTYSQFYAGIEERLNEDPDIPALRRTVASMHSWISVVESIENVTTNILTS